MSNNTISVNESLLVFFRNVAKKEPSVLSSIEQFTNFDVNAKQWKFTLFDLYSFLQCYNNEFQNIEYNKFRKALYNSPVNQEIKVLGAEIIIASNQDHVDSSTYLFVWH